MKVCVSCQKNVEGMEAVAVQEDRVIRTIRAVKQKLNIAQMNELYVCKTDLEEHMKRRKSFEKSMLFASVLAGLLFIVIVVALLLSGRFEIFPIFSSIIIAAFVLVLPLFKYTPALDGTETKLIVAGGEAMDDAPEKPKEAKAKKTKKKSSSKKKQG